MLIGKNFEWKKMLLKIGKSALYIFLAGIAATYGDNPYYIAVAPILAGAENFLKHRKD